MSVVSKLMAVEFTNVSKNPLLDDVLEDHHQNLLERGNLGRKRILPDPIFVQKWESTGYLARILETTCDACGSIHSSLIGVFHTEKNLSDTTATREIALDLRRFRDLNLTPSIKVDIASVPLCAHCVENPVLPN
jgi:hypothetical protein